MFYINHAVQITGVTNPTFYVPHRSAGSASYYRTSWAMYESSLQRSVKIRETDKHFPFPQISDKLNQVQSVLISETKEANSTWLTQPIIAKFQ